MCNYRRKSNSHWSAQVILWGFSLGNEIILAHSGKNFPNNIKQYFLFIYSNGVTEHYNLKPDRKICVHQGARTCPNDPLH